MNITLSKNIDARGCIFCSTHRPWDLTLAKVATNLQAHGVNWPNFVIMHGKDKSCAGVESDLHDRGLYVVATTADGSQAKKAEIFAREAPYFVGIDAVLKDRAFRHRKRRNQTAISTQQEHLPTKRKKGVAESSRGARAGVEVSRIPLATGERQLNSHQQYKAAEEAVENAKDASKRESVRRAREDASRAAAATEAKRRKSLGVAAGKLQPDSRSWNSGREK